MKGEVSQFWVIFDKDMYMSYSVSFYGFDGARRSAIEYAREVKTDVPESIVEVEGHDIHGEILLSLTIHDPQDEPFESNYREFIPDLPHFRSVVRTIVNPDGSTSYSEGTETDSDLYRSFD